MNTYHCSKDSNIFYKLQTSIFSPNVWKGTEPAIADDRIKENGDPEGRRHLMPQLVIRFTLEIL
jgi:hypothetical protein